MCLQKGALGLRGARAAAERSVGARQQVKVGGEEDVRVAGRAQVGAVVLVDGRLDVGNEEASVRNEED